MTFCNKYTSVLMFKDVFFLSGGSRTRTLTAHGLILNMWCRFDVRYVYFKYVVQRLAFARNSEKFSEILKNQSPSFSEFLAISNMFSNMWISNSGAAIGVGQIF